MDDESRDSGPRGEPHAIRDLPVDAADKTVAAVLGEIVWLMGQSAEHKQATIADLEWMVMPAILLRQFRLFYKDGRPVAAVLYALASEPMAERLREGVAPLEPDHWRSGEKIVVVRTIAPFGGGKQLAAEVTETLN